MRFLDRFVPPSLRRDEETAASARTLILFSLSDTLFALPILGFFLLHGLWPQAHNALFFVLLSFSGTVALLWWSKGLRVPVHFKCVLNIGAALLTAVQMGGLHSPSIAWVVTMPAFAAFLLGKWEARLWAFIVLLILLVLSLLHLSGTSPLNTPPDAVLQSAGGNGFVHLAVSLGVLVALPFLVRAGGTGRSPSQLLSCQFTAAFLFVLSILDRGAAFVPWLASIPLYLLLLCPDRVANIWSGICAVALLLFGSIAVAHPHLPALPLEWVEKASGSLYLSGLLLFSLVGIGFEMRRRKAVQEMKEALSALHHAHNQLIHLHKEKDEFLGIVTHDLKSPLTTITGYTEMILEEGPANPHLAKEWCAQILASSQQMMGLITNLLNTHSLESGMARFRIEEVDLARIVAASAECHVVGARKKSLEIVRELPPNPAIVRTDAQAAHHILDNLLSNAVKYSPKGGDPIRVRLVEAGDYYQAEVSDAGPGIGAEDQSRLFQKFTRLTARPTNGESSTGLGLSIARQMTEKLGGTLTLVSELGKGSTFILRLPRSPEGSDSGTEAIA